MDMNERMSWLTERSVFSKHERNWNLHFNIGEMQTLMDFYMASN